MAPRTLATRLALRAWQVYLLGFGSYRVWSLARRFAWSLFCQFGEARELPHAPLPVTGLHLALGLFGVAPIVGFIFQRAVLQAPVWRAWLAFSIVWSLYDVMVYGPSFAESSAAEVLGPALAVASAYLVVAPCWLALYWYAFRSPHLWERAAGEAPAAEARRLGWSGTPRDRTAGPGVSDP